ncbi:hypothetical protein NDU88_002725 [Pleurodeles waltl]|uniref:Uncharacterized protein n=1 Tax=Pleurodeles waltl TaxID=8319 RepID=A0AAV7T2W8_PLEWA|nr:hypothetical protein NDU88_002725 [Pleurodeles waltl]
MNPHQGHQQFVVHRRCWCNSKKDHRQMIRGTICSGKLVVRTREGAEMTTTSHAPVSPARVHRRSKPCVHGTAKLVGAAPLLCGAGKKQPLRIRRNSSSSPPIKAKIIGKPPNTLEKSEWMADGMTQKTVWMDTKPDPTALKKWTIPVVLESLNILDTSSPKFLGKLVFNRDCILADDLTIWSAYISLADVKATCF